MEKNICNSSPSTSLPFKSSIFDFILFCLFLVDKDKNGPPPLAKMKLTPYHKLAIPFSSIGRKTDDASIPDATLQIRLFFTALSTGKCHISKRR